MTDPRRYLSQTGQVYVTLAAARSYAQDRGLGEEAARRELTELMLDATPRASEPGEPEAWRYRSRGTGVDVSARVVREGRLAVVVAASARRYGSDR